MEMRMGESTVPDAAPAVDSLVTGTSRIADTAAEGEEEDTKEEEEDVDKKGPDSEASIAIGAVGKGSEEPDSTLTAWRDTRLAEGC